MRTLWGWVFAPIGFLLVLASASVAILTAADVLDSDVWLDSASFELWIDRETPPQAATDEFRIPSPGGDRELVIARRGLLSFAVVRRPGEALDDKAHYGVSVVWNGVREDLPIEIAWMAEDLVRFTYCDPVPNWTSLELHSTAGEVHAEYVRAEGCTPPPPEEPEPSYEEIIITG